MPATESFDAEIARITGRPLEEGHRLEKVKNGDVFDALEALIDGARTSLHLLIYIWQPGEASDRVIAALERRCRSGVSIRVAVDHFGSRSGFKSKVLPHLQRLGCEIRTFHPMGRLGAWSNFARTHRKVVVADGQRALTGGFAIWDTFLGDGVAKGTWRDTNLLVEGPAVRYMQHAFLENWREAGGALPPLFELPWPSRDAGATAAAFIESSSTDPLQTRAKALMSVLLPAAQRRLWIASAYFAPEEAQLALLTRAARNGVDVRLLVPGPVHDVPPLREAGRATYGRLLESGVRLWEYQPAMMHAKTVVVDEDVGLIGSINLEPSSLNLLEEGSLLFRDRALTSSLAADFEADLQHAKEITLETVPAPVLNPLRSFLRTVSGTVTRAIAHGRSGMAAG